jgi:small-conductance mechanosensitive channel
MREMLRDYLEPFFNLLNYNIFALGDAKITPLSILYLIFLTIALIYLSNKLRSILIERMLGRTSLDLGARQAIGTITRYFILFVGFLVILQTVGINLTTLNVLAGAIGIGVGFGLQNVASNFISGLIILLERPIKAGDRIEVDDINGRVISVGARSTHIKTNDNITIIVPNSKFITENVINWSYGGGKVRFRIPVGVAYDSDVDLAKRLLIEAATENQDVLPEPKPDVRLTKFDDSSINLELWAWSATKLHRKTAFLSDLNFAILRKFRANDVEIPFPQRDLHVRSGSLKTKGDAVSFGEGSEQAENDAENANSNGR